MGKENLFFIVTGSSSVALETSTDSVRRKIKASILPMNLQEYLKLKYKFFPPSGTSDMIRDVIFTGKNEAIQRHIENEKELHKKLINLPRAFPKLQITPSMSYPIFIS